MTTLAAASPPQGRVTVTLQAGQSIVSIVDGTARRPAPGRAPGCRGAGATGENFLSDVDPAIQAVVESRVDNQ